MDNNSDFYNKKLAIIGSTGSIGTQAIDVCLRGGIKVSALSANSSAATLERQARALHPAMCALTDESAASELKLRLADTDIRVYSGERGLLEMISDCDADTLLNSVIGGAGLLPTMAAIQSKKNVALANKETLVTAGELVMREVKRAGVTLMPVDSEHCAIFECLMSGRHDEVTRLIITASGGPFYKKKREDLVGVTREMALAHPTWSMGAKITIDSATLMNKCFEMIEAAHLFDIPIDKIEPVIHRESIVHSMVEFADGAVIAQMAMPDMRMCIQYALSYPDRIEGATPKMDFSKAFSLTFDRPDYETFKPLSLARFVMNEGGVLPALLNGVNDEATKLFLEGKISFLDIGDVADSIVRSYKNRPIGGIDDVVTVGQIGRELARVELGVK